MAELEFRINPPRRRLPDCCAVLNGSGGDHRDYRVDRYRTTLSLKAVVRGWADYRTPQGHHRVTEDSFLVLNHGQEYSLEIEAGSKTETLCPFFRSGFVEQAAQEAGRSPERRLDDVGARPPATEFCERLYPKSGAVARVLARLHSGLRSPPATGPWLEDQFYALAGALADLRARVEREVETFPGLRPATRAELYRRLHRGRDYLSSCYGEPLTVAAVARVAILSPFHFQRMFKLAFGQTPMRFLQERRLAAARRLLLTTDEHVTSICLDVGFESLGSFSWLFHKRFGEPPDRFRRQRRGKENPQD